MTRYNILIDGKVAYENLSQDEYFNKKEDIFGGEIGERLNPGGEVSKICTGLWNGVGELRGSTRRGGGIYLSEYIGLKARSCKMAERSETRLWSTFA